MPKRIVILQGHPHNDPRHFCAALAREYAKGAKEAGHRVVRHDLAKIDLPILADPSQFLVAPPPHIVDIQDSIRAADHLVVIYPLWLGTMPGLVKVFFEQLSRNNFAIANNDKGGWPRKMLKGKSARVIVTMGMPAAAYKLFFGAHGVKSLESGILGMAGIKPVKETLIGGAGEVSQKQADRHFARMRTLGAAAS